MALDIDVVKDSKGYQMEVLNVPGHDGKPTGTKDYYNPETKTVRPEKPQSGMTIEEVYKGIEELGNTEHATVNWKKDELHHEGDPATSAGIGI